MPIYSCKFIQFLHTEKPNCLNQTSFGTNFCVWYIQVELTKISYIGTLYFLSLVYTRFQFILSLVMQDSSLFTVRLCMQDSSLFKVWLCRIPVYSKFGYAGFQFIQSSVMWDSSLFRVQCIYLHLHKV